MSPPLLMDDVLYGTLKTPPALRIGQMPCQSYIIFDSPDFLAYIPRRPSAPVACNSVQRHMQQHPDI